MKSQLRGRIRRNLTTLLELGADVTVLTVPSRNDLFVGLEHPRLRAEYLPAPSIYMKLAEATSSAARIRRRDRREQRRTMRPAGPVVRTLAGGFLLLRRVLLVVLAATGIVVATLRRLLRRSWRALWPPVRALGWTTARAVVRRRRAARRSWERRVEAPVRHLLATTLRRMGQTSGLDHPGWQRSREARALRARRRRHRRRTNRGRARLRLRRHLTRRLARGRAAIAGWVVAELKKRLRPWHRVNRFLAFWEESAERTVALRPDLVASSDLPGLVGAGRAARELGVGHFHDCHELYLESSSFRPSERAALQPFERRWLRAATAAIAVNQSIAVEYERRYGRKPRVVRNCVPRVAEDLRPSDIRGVLGLDPTARVVLYQGGFAAGRGLELCVEAAALLPVGVHLVMLGYGPLRDDLMRRAREWSVSDRVHLLDAVPPDELGAWTAAADVGLMPYQPVSHNNRLALPNKVFEYTAVGVPVVTSDLPELRRIAVDAGCGAVYDPFDPASLAKAIDEVLEPTRHEAHRAAARRFGRENAWENEREILLAEFARLCPALAADRDINAPDTAVGVLE